MVFYKIDELLPYLNKLKEQKNKIVFTNGCFDILHAGHVDYLEEAKKLGDILIIGINSDNSIKRIKGENRPILPLKYRIRALEGLKAVDIIIPFEEETPYNLIKAIKPDILIKGSDWKGKNVVGSDIVTTNGGNVKFIDFKYNISTSQIITKIIDKYCNEK